MFARITLNVQKDTFVLTMNASVETAKMIKIVTSMECFAIRHLNQVWDNAVSGVPRLRSGQNGVDVGSTKFVTKCLKLMGWSQEYVNLRGV